MRLDFAHPFWDRLSIVLVHFVWQAAAAVLLVGLLVAIWRPRRPQVRYGMYLLTFLALPCCALLTFILVGAAPSAATDRVRLTESAAAEMPLLNSPSDEELRNGGRERSASNSAEPPRPAEPSSAFEPSTWSRWLDIARPWLIPGWLSGVALFSLRLLLGAAAIAAIRRQATAVPGDIFECVRRLSAQLGLRVPRVVASHHVRQALAAGLFRPVIVLPASWATGLSPQMAEAVLAHELAHLRRHDVWLNAAQRVVESVFFYHPAVWWLSGRVRAERELCCDDLAVAATGDRLAYASALELAVRGSSPARGLLLANGIGGRKMAVLERVRYVLNLEPGGRRAWWPGGGLAALALPALVWCAATGWQPVRAGNHEPGLAQAGERDTAEDGSASDPWDVVVFKDPESPGTNYIKGLVELPEEAIAQRAERPNKREDTEHAQDAVRRDDAERRSEDAERERTGRLRELEADPRVREWRGRIDSADRRVREELGGRRREEDAEREDRDDGGAGEPEASDRTREAMLRMRLRRLVIRGDGAGRDVRQPSAEEVEIVRELHELARRRQQEAVERLGANGMMKSRTANGRIARAMEASRPRVRLTRRRPQTAPLTAKPQTMASRSMSRRCNRRNLSMETAPNCFGFTSASRGNQSFRAVGPT